MIKSLILGAGLEVGKSCVVVTTGGKNIMFDCGMHMGYNDERRFPDFSLISKCGDFTQVIDCVIITHFHLDHVGALPYFTEVCGYEGPIFMTYPTKALAPLMLEDYRKVLVERRGEQEQFSVLQIHDCMRKVTAVDLRQTITVGNDIQLRAYYAGHVLGAAMFHVKVGESSVIYTGDYNMTPDRHLGSAQIDRLRPDLIITESTYATTIREAKHAREREFLKAVHTCIAGGGKVLIPVFALGRAQELCILMDDYWERMNLKAPIYFSAGLTMQATVYYKLLISWTSQRVKDTCVTRNTFDFKHVSAFDRSQMNAVGPCVLFATPGMLSGGLSLEVFKQWAPSEKNMVVVPGYCVPGTVGHRLVQGKTVRVDARTSMEVRCQVHHLSFSAHTDAKGIMDLLHHVGPKHVILVHGEQPKMALLKTRVTSELGVPCFAPGNGEVVEVPSRLVIKVLATERFLAGDVPSLEDVQDTKKAAAIVRTSPTNLVKMMPSVNNGLRSGIVMMNQDRAIQVMHPEEVLPVLNVSQHEFLFKCYCPIHMKLDTSKADPYMASGVPQPDEQPKKRYCKDAKRIPSLDLEQEPKNDDEEDDDDGDAESCLEYEQECTWVPSLKAPDILDAVYLWLVKWLGCTLFTKDNECIIGRSVRLRVCTDHDPDCQRIIAATGKARVAAIVACNWSSKDEILANRVVPLLSTLRVKAE